jgi:WD40 repeat protein/serine/threonine protein kinase
MSPKWLEGLFSKQKGTGSEQGDPVKAEIESPSSLLGSSRQDLAPSASPDTSGFLPDGEDSVCAQASISIHEGPPTDTFCFIPGFQVDGSIIIQKQLGQGMLFDNYLARQERWDIDVVLKVPRELFRHNPKSLQYLSHAGTNWNAMGLHPNIVLCHRILQIENVPVLMVEYLDGGNLRDWIAEGWCADLKLGLDLALQFCHALEFAHHQGVVHKAIKPENVLLQRDGTLKVTDFGLSVLESNPELLTQYRQLAEQPNGASDFSLPPLPHYLAPEQLQDATSVDLRADIFAFGVCLYEMFCGRHPYDNVFGPRQEAPGPRDLRGDTALPARLCRLMQRSVEWDRNRRPNLMGEIRKELCGIYMDLFRQPSAFTNPPDPFAEQEGEEARRVPWLQVEQEEIHEENDRAVALVLQGSEEEALRCFQQIQSSGRTSLESAYNHGLLLWRQGQIDDRELLLRLERLASSPGIKPRGIAMALADIHLERGDPESARTVLANFPDVFERVYASPNPMTMGQRLVLRGHSKAGSAVALTPDGRRGLSGSNDHTLRLWSLQNGTMLHTVDLGNSGASAVALAGDGTIGLAEAQKNLRLWNIETGRCLRTFEGHTNYVVTCAMTPDGRIAISGGWDKTLRVWDVASGDSLAILEGHGNYITASALTPDGRLALTGSWDNSVRLWDLTARRCLITLSGHENYVVSVAMTPDGRTGISGSTDKTMRLWNLDTGHCLRVLSGHGSWVDAVALSADGRWALSGSKDKTLKLWDLTTGQCLRTLEGHTGGVSSVALTPDGRLGFSSSQDSTLRLWDLNPLQRRIAQFKSTKPLPPPSRNQQPAKPFDPIPVKQAAPSTTPTLAEEGAGTVRPTPVQTSSPRMSATAPPPQTTSPAPPNHGGSRTQALPKATPNDPDYGQIEILFSQGQHQLSYECLFKSWSIKKFHTDKRLAQQYRQLYPQGISAGLEQIVPQFAINDLGPQLKTALSVNGQLGLTGGIHRELKVWDLAEGRCLKSMEGHNASIVSLAVTADGRQAMSGDSEQNIKVWNLENGQCVRSLSGVSHLALYVSLTTDGRKGMSTGEGHSAQLWDLRSGQCLQTLQGHAGPVTCVAISPDGLRGISGSEDHTLRFWNLETGSTLFQLEGHSGRISAVTMDARARYAVSASLDRSIRFWDLSAGGCLLTSQMSHSVCSVTLSADATALLTAQENGLLTYWLLLWKLEFMRH